MAIIKNNVFVINYTGKKGGGALDSLEIAKALFENGINVVPIISKSVDNYDDWYKVGFFRIVAINTYNSIFSFVLNSVLFFFKQRRIIKKATKDLNVEFVFSPMIAFWTGKVNRLFKKALKAIVVHDPVHHSGTNKFADFFLDSPYKRADFLIVHSKQFLEYTQEKYKKRTYYFPLGAHNHYSKDFIPSFFFPYDDNKTNFLFFGRIEEYKGIDLLIDAFSQLEKKYGNLVSLVVVGEGDITKYSEQLSKIKNLTLVNKWIPDNEIASYFHGNNVICVCPYKDATQSGIVLMSYAFGIPVIASNTGGLSEQVIDGMTGFLVEPNSISSLLSTMENVLLCPFLTQNMKTNISNYLKEISWDSNAKKLINFYNDEASSRKNK